MPEVLPPTNVELFRQSRRIVPILVDYFPDKASMTLPDRVAYCDMLRDKLGIEALRTEFRMRRLISAYDSNGNATFDSDTARVYKESLEAMRKAGLKGPTITLFSPTDEMQNMAKESPESYSHLFRQFVTKVKDICREAGVAPEYIQVWNEINLPFQNQLPLDRVVEMIRIAHEVFKSDPIFKEKTKIITSLSTTSSPPVEEETLTKQRLRRVARVLGKEKGIPQFINWRKDTQEIIEKARENLDGVGFDAYHGTYERYAFPNVNLLSPSRLLPRKARAILERIIGKQPGTNLLRSRPFWAFGSTVLYEWIAEQKLHGVLRDKTVIINETGVFDSSKKTEYQRFGYDRMIQGFDHFLLQLERKGIKAHDIFAGISFFTGGDFPEVHTMAPMRLDFNPWTLVRMRKDGGFDLTAAGKRLKYLVQTRIHPTGSAPPIAP